MARSTISIPDDLKARMDAAPGRVNWSAVAAAAFEEKVISLWKESEAAFEKKFDERLAVIERLKATKQLDR